MKNIFEIAHNPAPFSTTRPIEISVDFATISGWRLLHRMLCENVFNVSDRYIGKLIRGAMVRLCRSVMAVA